MDRLSGYGRACSTNNQRGGLVILGNLGGDMLNGGHLVFCTDTLFSVTAWRQGEISRSKFRIFSSNESSIGQSSLRGVFSKRTMGVHSSN